MKSILLLAAALLAMAAFFLPFFAWAMSLEAIFAVTAASCYMNIAAVLLIFFHRACSLWMNSRSLERHNRNRPPY